MARRRTGNTINSLFRGIAQGLQLGQQIKGQRRKGKLEERGLGIREQQLSLNERQIAIQEAQADLDEKNRANTLKVLGPFLQSLIPGFGEQPSQAPAAPQQRQVPTPAPVPTPRPQVRPQVAPQPQVTRQPTPTRAAPAPAQTFLPGEFPTTPTAPPAETVLDRAVSDLGRTEAELNTALRQFRIEKPIESFTDADFEVVRNAIENVEQNPKSITQLQNARGLRELIQQREQQQQEAGTLPQVIEGVTRDLNITSEARFGAGEATIPPLEPTVKPTVAITPPAQAPIQASAAQEPDVTLERQQQVATEFSQFDAELQRIRKQLGLPDFTISGKAVGIPIDFRVSAPSEKRTIRRLKTAFIADQKERGIRKFDILAFKQLLKDSGVSTAELQGDLDKAFEAEFNQATSGIALARLSKAERGPFERDILNDMGAKFGIIPKKFEDKANIALSGNRIKVNVKLGNDPKTGRPITRVGFALKDAPTDIIFIGKPTTAGAAARVTVRNLPQIPSVLLSGITQSNLALKSVARIDEILSRVDVDSLVGPVDAPIATLLEGLGFPNADQQTIGNITRDLTDALGRMRSGGVISEQEWETFTALVPQRNDPAPTFVNKLNDFRAKMNDIKSVNLEAAETFGFNVGTSAPEFTLKELEAEKARRSSGRSK